jgi:hypothetical protein
MPAMAATVEISSVLAAQTSLSLMKNNAPGDSSPLYFNEYLFADKSEKIRKALELASGLLSANRLRRHKQRLKAVLDFRSMVWQPNFLRKFLE